MCRLTDRLLKFIHSYAVDILLTVLFIAAAYISISSYSEKLAENAPHKLEAQITFHSVSSSNLPVEGDVLYLSDGSVFGTVTSVSSVAASEWHFTAGEYQLIQLPGKDISIKVSVDAVKKDMRYTVCDKPLLIGDVHRLHTVHFAGDAHITGINADQTEEE